jgi:predicted amidohydrolase
MKICVAQTRPVTGDIQQNISRHLLLTDLAASSAADAIIFPELSLTGYEPTMAEALAIDPDDSRLDDLFKVSEARQITIGAGIPTRHTGGISISMVIFQPGKARQLYSKRYLHADEEPFFVSGPDATGLIGEKNDLALAICYEISVPEHAEQAFNNGAKIYVASVAKFANGIDKALPRLSSIAKDYSMTVLMANSIGPADGGICAGKTSIWNDRGELMEQLDDSHEGILIIDTETREVIEGLLPAH